MIAMNVNQEAIAETYQDVHNLIRHAVWRFQRTHGGDAEDMFSEANVIFMKAFASHDESKASFSTWLQIKIQKAFLETERESCRKRVCYYDLERPADTIQPFCDVLSELSRDARTIVELLLELPESLQETILKKGTHPKNTKYALKIYLKTFFGWTEKHVMDTFKEIAEVIND